MAGITSNLLWGELAVSHPFIARVLPGSVAAGHRGHVLVAHLLQRPSSDQRAHAAGAVGNDRRALIRHGFFDPYLQEPARQGEGTVKMPFAVLLTFAHVQKRP